tara:strand:- start:1024 stop:1707 length:684 start_codon:yes stop_codon:yes gene_type:complete
MLIKTRKNIKYISKGKGLSSSVKTQKKILSDKKNKLKSGLEEKKKTIYADRNQIVSDAKDLANPQSFLEVFKQTPEDIALEHRSLFNIIDRTPIDFLYIAAKEAGWLENDNVTDGIGGYECSSDCVLPDLICNCKRKILANVGILKTNSHCYLQKCYSDVLDDIDIMECGKKEEIRYLINLFSDQYSYWEYRDNWKYDKDARESFLKEKWEELIKILTNCKPKKHIK